MNLRNRSRDNGSTKRHFAWLAVGLLLFVVPACSLGKKSTNVSTNRSASEDSAPSDATSTGAIKELHMAKDDGNGNPGDETSAFSPGDRTIHCVAKLAEAKAGTKMKFSWFIVDADGAKNEKIKDIDYTTRALENIVHGHLTLPQNWPSGKYKVEVFVNGNLEKTAQYSVK
ncbi:MAG: hypothetical protein H0W28_02335 [Pyrinomonadaceae bacterium]|nr:hypothetical protein [Pyrinomonadaceae bacterium]MDQ3175188.1 hypothetical protein [Acidobacteriota bacterium]